MILRPDHCPRVDVKELAATARLVSLIADTSGEMRPLHLVPLIRDRPVPSVGDQGQATQNVLDRDKIDYRLWLGLIEELGSGVGDLPPPIWLPPAGWYKSNCQMMYLSAYKTHLEYTCVLSDTTEQVHLPFVFKQVRLSTLLLLFYAPFYFFMG
jgi:hypothetical protein